LTGLAAGPLDGAITASSREKILASHGVPFSTPEGFSQVRTRWRLPAAASTLWRSDGLLLVSVNAFSYRLTASL